MKTLKKQLKAIWQDESAQGATEYILLLVAIVALVVLFKDRLLGDGGAIQNLIGNLSQSLSNFK